jgi:acetyl-CoA acetyltransferase
MAALAALRRHGFSREDLTCALIQWKAENGALGLHPGALLRALGQGRLEPDLARAVDRVTLAAVNQALQAWLEPDRLRYLLLGADAPMLQAAEQAGLAPSAILGD